MFIHRAKKSLGQNFLTSTDIVKHIVTSGQVTETDTVVEIGPGKGILTRELLLAGASVIAVEKDDQLFEYLGEEFADNIKSGKLKVFHADALEDILSYMPSVPYKLIANIPYYITGKIISTFLEGSFKPTCMVLMVQYEVADRIARSPEHSILSLSVHAYGTPKLVRRVPAGAFHPKPKVDSAILAVYDISDKFFKENWITEGEFFSAVKSGFAHKRKKLISNLRGTFAKPDLKTIFVKLELSENTRAEDVSLEYWGKITREIFV